MTDHTMELGIAIRFVCARARVRVVMRMLPSESETRSGHTVRVCCHRKLNWPKYNLLSNRVHLIAVTESLEFFVSSRRIHTRSINAESLDLIKCYSDTIRETCTWIPLGSLIHLFIYLFNEPIHTYQ